MTTDTLPAGFRQLTAPKYGLVADVSFDGNTPVQERRRLMRDLGFGEYYLEKFSPTDTWKPYALTWDEWKVIQTYFPKRYGFEGEALSSFELVDIPEPVLKFWAEAKGSDDFEQFQIRTTEDQGINAIASIAGTLDPILIGFRRYLADRRYVWPYRLAQWGLDNPLDASMWKMARRVAQICLMRVKQDIRSGGHGARRRFLENRRSEVQRRLERIPEYVSARKILAAS